MQKREYLSLETTHPHLAKEYHPTKNTIPLSEIDENTQETVWWICNVCGDEWQTTPFSRTNIDASCHQCNKFRITPTHNLLVLYPFLSSEWHPTLNGTSTPAKVAPNSKKIAWWRCSKCQHVWQAMVSNRSRLGKGCSECRYDHLAEIHVGVTPNKRDLLIYEYPDIAAEFHPTKNVGVNLKDLTSGSSKLKIWWLCSTCEHEWQTNVSSRTYHGTGCPKCNRNRVSSEHNLLVTYPEIAKEWDYERNVDVPSDVAPKIQKAYHWICSACAHKWKANIAHRTVQGSGCPECAKKLRQKSFKESVKVFRLSNPDKITIKDVAALLGISVSAAQKRVHDTLRFPQPHMKFLRSQWYSKSEVEEYAKHL